MKYWIQCFLFSLISAASPAQEMQFREIPMIGDRLSGVVIPVLPRDSNITINALRADAWTVDKTKRLILSKDVVISIGTYVFQTDLASVWVNRMPTEEGLVSQIAVYIPASDQPAARATLGVPGNDLLVVGSTFNEIKMDVALLTQKKPTEQRVFIRQSEERLAGYIQRLQLGKTELSIQPKIFASPSPLNQDDPLVTKVPIKQSKQTWLRSRTGVISITADQVDLNTGETENTITIVGNVVLEHRSASGKDDMQMTADRAVIFTDPGSIRDMAAGRVESQDIRGIYLEGNVLVDSNHGQYLVRSPQAYYDFETDQAMLVESVLRTYGMGGKVPLFVRAKEMQQIAENEWDAQGVQVSTSSFATPDLAIRSANLNITEKPDGSMFVKSTHNTLRMGGTPIAYWPFYEGEADEIPLHNVNYGYQDSMGSFLRTEWDLFTLWGKKNPKGISTDIKINGYEKRGVGVGLDTRYSLENHKGHLDMYFLADSGEQKTSSGIKLDVEDQKRGYVLWDDQTKFGNWKIQSQFSYISDPTYISVWERGDFKNRREYETSLYVKYQKNNMAFTALGSYDVNRFISNSWLLASRQYSVEKSPELGLFRYGDNLFGGAVTWSSESRITRERMVFQDGTPASNGLKRRAFTFPDGTFLGNNQQFSDLLTAQGLTQGYRNRFVTRHEFTAPFSIGDIKVAPFGSIQANVPFNNNDASQDDTQWFSTIGVHASTQIQRVFNDVHNDILDMHRLRHVIEPYATIWFGSGSVNPTSIPQYNALVDNVSTGTAAWFGVKNKLQTWRGGPGRWYEVDWLTLDVAVLTVDNKATRRYETPQFFSWRPEYSALEDSVMANGVWQLSDGVALLGNGTWLTDDGKMVRGSVGAELDHGRDVRTFVEYREIKPNDDKYLALGVKYKLSKRYSLSASPTWNLKEDDLQSLRLTLTRHYPDFDLVGLVTHNSIRDETSFGIAFRLLKF